MAAAIALQPEGDRCYLALVSISELACFLNPCDFLNFCDFKDQAMQIGEPKNLGCQASH